MTKLTVLLNFILKYYAANLRVLFDNGLVKPLAMAAYSILIYGPCRDIFGRPEVFS
jgi:hypothetical protein